MTVHNGPMRYVQIKLHGETLSSERKQQLMVAIQHALERVTGNDQVPTCVAIDEVVGDNWQLLGMKEAPLVNEGSEGHATGNLPPAQPAWVSQGEFKYKPGVDFGDTGIVAHLAGRPGSPYRNPADAGLMVVNSSALMHDSLPASAIVGNEVVRCCTKPQVNSWFELDFRRYRVCPTHYALRHYASWDTEALRTWVLDGSEDGIDWVRLSSIENDTSLDKAGATHTWPVSAQATKGLFFRYLRLRQTGPNSNDHHYLALSGFEVYGKLVRRDGSTATGEMGVKLKPTLSKSMLERLRQLR